MFFCFFRSPFLSKNTTHPKHLNIGTKEVRTILSIFLSNYLICAVMVFLIVGLTRDLPMILGLMLFLCVGLGHQAFLQVVKWNQFVVGYSLSFILWFWITGSMGILLFCIILSLMGSIIHSSLKKRDPLQAAKTTIKRTIQDN